MEKKILRNMFKVKELDSVFRSFLEIPEDNTQVSIIELDEMDFFNKKHIEEKQGNHFDGILVSKDTREIFVNEDEFRKEPFLTLISVFEELFPFYQEQLDFITQADFMQEKFHMMGNVVAGVELWKSFVSLYYVTSIMKVYFSDYQEVEGYGENPYYSDNNRKNITSLMDKVENMGIEESLPMLLLCFASNMVYEHDIDFSSYTDKGDKLQKFYEALNKAADSELNMFRIYNIGKAYTNLIGKPAKGGEKKEKIKKEKKQKPKDNKPKGKKK